MNISPVSFTGFLGGKIADINIRQDTTEQFDRQVLQDLNTKLDSQMVKEKAYLDDMGNIVLDMAPATDILSLSVSHQRFPENDLVINSLTTGLFLNLYTCDKPESIYAVKDGCKQLLEKVCSKIERLKETLKKRVSKNNHK